MSPRISRSAFLRLSLTAAPALLWSRGLAAQAPVDPEQRERVADVYRMFHLLGSHRTATDPDHDTAEWLADECTKRGAEVSPRTFTLQRVDLKASYIEAGGSRREGVPFFDGGFTTADGLSGRLGRPGSGSPIVLVTLDATAIGTEGATLGALRRDAAVRAIVAITDGGEPGLCPSNALAFTAPYGVPVLQVSSSTREWLEGLAQAGADVRLVAHAERTATTAENTLAIVRGRQPQLPPVVVMTPRSGWWQCVSERGGGLACWLEIMRTVALVRPARTVRFLASSGHELGHLGLDAFLREEPALIKSAAAWLHLGANIGAVGSLMRLQSASDEIEAIAEAAAQTAGASVDRKVPRGTVPAGEARNIHVGGARYVSFVGANASYFHNPMDLWPTSVNLDAAVRYAAATTSLTLALAKA